MIAYPIIRQNHDLLRSIMNLILSILQWVATFLSFVGTGIGINMLPLGGVNQIEPAYYFFFSLFLIYPACIVYGVYQALPQQRENGLLRKIGYFSATAFFLNTLLAIGTNIGWNQWLLTLITILALGALFGGFNQIIKYQSPLAKVEIRVVMLPISVLTGWMTMITFFFIASAVVAANIEDIGLFSENWAIMLIIALGIVASWVIVASRGNEWYAFTIIGSLIEIMIVNISHDQNKMLAVVAGATAFIVALVLLITILLLKDEKMRYGIISSHLSRHSILFISFEFALFYSIFALLSALLYWHLGESNPQFFSFKQGQLDFLQSLYFSFIAQSTSGYGDIVPIGSASKALAVAQGILGLILTGIWVGVLIVKWFSAGDRNSILFADWAGYSLAEERFFILFVNRNKEDLVDVNINSIVKLSSMNPVPPGLNAPYIGKSAWTFSFSKVPIAVLSEIDLDRNDGIKVSISGTAGMTRCTNWRKYTLDQIFVFNNRDYFWSDIFDSPKFDKEFFENFSRPCADWHEEFLKFDFKNVCGNYINRQQGCNINKWKRY